MQRGIQHKKPYFSDRDKLLTRMWKMFIYAGLCTENDRHAFSHYAKGKTQNQMFLDLNNKNFDLQYWENVEKNKVKNLNKGENR